MTGQKSTRPQPARSDHLARRCSAEANSSLEASSSTNTSSSRSSAASGSSPRAPFDPQRAALTSGLSWYPCSVPERPFAGPDEVPGRLSARLEDGRLRDRRISTRGCTNSANRCSICSTRRLPRTCYVYEFVQSVQDIPSADRHPVEAIPDANSHRPGEGGSEQGSLRAHRATLTECSTNHVWSRRLVRCHRSGWGLRILGRPAGILLCFRYWPDSARSARARAGHRRRTMGHSAGHSGRTDRGGVIYLAIGIGSNQIGL